MRIKFKIILIALALLLISPFVVRADNSSLWVLLQNNLQPVVKTYGLKIPSLATPNGALPCLTAGTTGKVATTTCGSGGSTNITAQYPLLYNSGTGLLNIGYVGDNDDGIASADNFRTWNSKLDNLFVGLIVTGGSKDTVLFKDDNGELNSSQDMSYYAASKGFMLGTTTYYGKLTIAGDQGSANSLFNVASSSSQSLFKIQPTGAIGFGNSLGSLGQVLQSNGSLASPTWVSTSSLNFLTTNVTEGSNLYYTPARVIALIDASSTIPKTYSSNTFTGANVFSGALTVTGLNGPLQANAGVVSATTSVRVQYGGTGLTAVPTLGQILVGNGTGYTLSATSTLGLIAKSDYGVSTGDILAADGAGGVTKLSPNAANGYVKLDSNGDINGYTIIPRTGTSTNIASIVLQEGELAVATNTKELFIGDGINGGGYPVTYWKKATSTNFSNTYTTAKVAIGTTSTSTAALLIDPGTTTPGIVIQTSDTMAADYLTIKRFDGQNEFAVRDDGSLAMSGGNVIINPAALGDNSTAVMSFFDPNTSGSLYQLFGDGSFEFDTTETSPNDYIVRGGLDNASNGFEVHHNFYVTSGNVGIGGTTTPFSKLSVTAASSAGTTSLFAVASSTKATLLNVLGNGNVGVGTTSPYAQLSVAGNLVIGAPTAGGTFGDLFLPKLGTTAGSFLAVDATGKVIATTTPSGGGGSGTVGSGTTGQVPYYAANGTTLTATSTIFIKNGRLGIGTTNPITALDVTGAINVTDSINAGDFGFNSGFQFGDLGSSGNNLHLFADGVESLNVGSSISYFPSFLGIGTTSPFANLSVSSATQRSGLLPLFAVASTTNATLFNVLGNGNVGIGTTSPYSKLSVAGDVAARTFNATTTTATSTFQGGFVVGNASTGFMVNNVGQVGVGGIPNSSDKFFVQGNARFNTTLFTVNASQANFVVDSFAVQGGSNYPDGLFFMSDSSQYIAIGDINGDSGSTSLLIDDGGLNIDFNSTAGTINFYAQRTMFRTGNVGLATTTPDSTLDVNGSVRFEGASSFVTASISGAIVGTGCDTADTTGLTGLASSTAFVTTPRLFPGNGIFAYTMALTSTSARTYVCSAVTVTPNASTYNVKIIK